MDLEPTEPQRELAERARRFAAERIAPEADRWEREERLPRELVQGLAERGFFGALVPRQWGGLGLDRVSYGLMMEELGRASSSVAGLLTVHGMVSLVLARWGTTAQKEQWLPRLAAGELLAAFALSEPEIGSDARSVQARVEVDGDAFVIAGHKKWITGARLAGLFLVIAQQQGAPCALLVPSDAPGLTIEPITGLLGFRSAMLGDCRLDRCRVHRDALVGKGGFGFSHIASTALDLGRYSVAWSCVGLTAACLAASASYASRRVQFGHPLRDHQLVQQMLARMATGGEAARLLCLRAGQLHDARAPRAIMETVIAKYFAAQVASRSASDAVQLHGANGVGGELPVQRYLRDAKVMEIIEGTTQLLETVIARDGLGSDGTIR